MFFPMPRLSSFVPASVGTDPITKLATKVYAHLDVDVEDVDECNVAHFYQCLKKNDDFGITSTLVK